MVGGNISYCKFEKVNTIVVFLIICGFKSPPFLIFCFSYVQTEFNLLFKVNSGQFKFVKIRFKKIHSITFVFESAYLQSAGEQLNSALRYFYLSLLYLSIYSLLQ